MTKTLEELQLEIAALRTKPRATVQQLERAEKRAALVARRAAARGHLQRAFAGDVDAARAAVEALPRRLERVLAQPPSMARRRAYNFTLAETAEAVKAAFDTGRRGHLAARGDSRTYVQQEDLDDLVPDGWGKRFPGEMKRLGRDAELPPLAMAALVLFTWCFQFRASAPGDHRRKGCGAQFSIDWLARKLGCWPSWVKEGVFNRLDPFGPYRRELAAVRRVNARRRREGRALISEPPRPRGTPYIERHRRLKRYAATRQRDGGSAAAWIDKNGKPRFFVDVRGVCYVTDAGRALLGRARASPAPGVPSEPSTSAGADVTRRLRPVAHKLERRLEKSTSPPSFAGAG